MHCISSKVDNIPISHEIFQFMLGIESWCEMLCDVSDDHGNTPLHIAATKGNLHAVKLLMSHNAKADAVNEDNKIPVHLAAEKGWHRWDIFYCKLNQFLGVM